MSSSPVLSTKGLNVGYGHRTVLQGIDTVVLPGTFTTLIGANGSGKSTLLRTLSGTQAPLEGYIALNGKDMAMMRRRELARSLSMVFTDRSGGGDQDFPPSVLRSRMYPSRLLSASVLAPQLTVIVLPPWMLPGTEMLLGVVGAVFVDTDPSSETKREEGNIKAGRTP